MSDSLSVSNVDVLPSSNAVPVPKRYLWQLGITAVFFLLLFSGFSVGKNTLIQAESVTAGNIDAQYTAIRKRGVPTSLQLNVDVTDTTSIVTFNTALIKNFHVESISPQPNKVTSSGDTISYSFSTVPGERVSIKLLLTPDILGSSSLTVTSGTNKIKVNQIFLP